MQHPKKAALALLLVSVRLICGAGALEWDQTRVSLVAQPEQPELTADFGFRNAGGGPVTITGIDSSCPCTTATSAKATYGPGEAGRIHAVFEVLNQTGLVRKKITITTDNAGAAPTELVLEVRIQQYASVEPRMVYWRMGGDTSEVRILCSAQSDHGITLSGVSCSLPDIVAVIDTLEPGRAYAVRLRSPPRVSHATAVISLRVDVAGVGPRVIDAYAYYR